MYLTRGCKDKEGERGIGQASKGVASLRTSSQGYDDDDGCKDEAKHKQKQEGVR